MVETEKQEGQGNSYNLEKFGYTPDNPLTQRLSDVLSGGNVGKRFAEYFGVPAATATLGLKSVGETEEFFKTLGKSNQPDDRLIKLAIGVDFGNQIEKGDYSDIKADVDNVIYTSFFQTEPEFEWTHPSFILKHAPIEDFAVIHEVMDTIGKEIVSREGSKPLDLTTPHEIFKDTDDVVIKGPRPVRVHPQIRKILDTYDNNAA